MRKITGLKLAPGEDEGKLARLAARSLGVKPEDMEELRILKKSLDARKKGSIHWVYSVAVRLRGDPPEQPEGYMVPLLPAPERRPVIAGFGPAGMFAALVLAKAGQRPIILERGPDAGTRKRQIEAFRNGGPFDPECNVQFGEGGAGTFSDGKLNTGTHDPRIQWVLEQFAAHGAKPSVVYDAKPHVGTDVLVNVVQSIRREVIALGGEVRFCHRLTGLRTEGGALRALEVSSAGGDYVLPCQSLILAVGHSARDTFEMLLAQNIPMEPKAFSMGARIEHRQADIDLAQYGRPRGKLPPADYTLSVHLPDGTSAYTFCMCPGGEVFAAASEEGGVVTNGMSYSGRAGENANAALLVTLHPEDFPYGGPLGGMYWQRDIERAVFGYGGGNYAAVSQRVGDFLAGRPSSGPGDVKPSYKPAVRWGELREVLPERVTRVMAFALPELGKKLRGFDSPDAVLTAPETRSSSPVRILRGADKCSALRGLYPCGEGAGYAGGITSAAVDGMRCAETVLAALSTGEPQQNGQG